MARPPHRPAGLVHVPEGRAIFSTLSVEENLTVSFTRRVGRKATPEALSAPTTRSRSWPSAAASGRHAVGGSSGSCRWPRCWPSAQAAHRGRALPRPGAGHRRPGLRRASSPSTGRDARSWSSSSRSTACSPSPIGPCCSSRGPWRGKARRATGLDPRGAHARGRAVQRLGAHVGQRDPRGPPARGGPGAVATTTALAPPAPPPPPAGSHPTDLWVVGPKFPNAN